MSKFCDETTPTQRLLQVVFGPAARTRQIAVVAGIGSYQNLDASQQLPPADYDVENIASIFVDRYHFDEVLVVKNGDFTRDNLEFLFERYLPDELEQNPKSRVVFAFSGHGADFGNAGYIFYNNTRTINPRKFTDLDAAISMDKLKAILIPTIERSHQFLALINSCYGGYFLTESAFSFSGSTLDLPGATAITAGGSNDKVQALPNIGSGKGSVFFEMVAAALNGTDIAIGSQRFENPSKNNGILTTTKLAAFLIDTTSKIENYKQTAHMGSIVPVRPGHEGEFFFIVDPQRARDALTSQFRSNAKSVFGHTETNFSNGFGKPTTESEANNPNLIIADNVIGNKYTIDNERPWERKVVFRTKGGLETGRQEIDEPRAIVVNDKLYFHFIIITGDIGNRDNTYNVILDEMDAISGAVYKIDEIDIKGAPSACFDFKNPVYHGDLLFYRMSCSGPIKSYKVASRDAPKQIHDHIEVGMDREFPFYPSPTGRFVALSIDGGITVTSSNFNSVPEIYRLALGATKQQLNGPKEKDGGNGEYTGLLLYDKLSRTREKMFRQKYTGDWSIGRFVWSEDESNLYFDNSGPVACIWRFDLKTRVLQKIVPEHEAKQPYIVRFEGTEYIIYPEAILGLLQVQAGVLKIARETL